MDTSYDINRGKSEGREIIARIKVTTDWIIVNVILKWHEVQEKQGSV